MYLKTKAIYLLIFLWACASCAATEGSGQPGSKVDPGQAREDDGSLGDEKGELVIPPPGAVPEAPRGNNNSSNGGPDPWVVSEVGQFWVNLETIKQIIENGRVVQETAKRRQALEVYQQAGQACREMEDVISLVASSPEIQSSGYHFGRFRSLSFHSAKPTGTKQKVVHAESVLGTVIEEERYACFLQVRASQFNAFATFSRLRSAQVNKALRDKFPP